MPNDKISEVFNMEILSYDGMFYCILVKKGKNRCKILYSPIQKELKIPEENKLSYELIENSYQLNKILRNKREDTFFEGFKLKFILKNNESAISLNDLSKIVVLDRRNGNYKVESIDKTENKIFKIYTDGCYLEKLRKGAYIVLIEKPGGLLNLYFKKTGVNSSSLIELMAVIEGLRRTEEIDSIRIVSDSRYVIKGLTEWMYNWKLNNWHTAQGEKVKNIRYWKLFDKLSKGKYIEFEWVKGHSNHYYNSICDYYAKLAAMKS